MLYTAIMLMLGSANAMLYGTAATRPVLHTIKMQVTAEAAAKAKWLATVNAEPGWRKMDQRSLKQDHSGVVVSTNIAAASTPNYGDDHTNPGERALRFGPPMGRLAHASPVSSAAQVYGDDHTHPGERALRFGPPMGRLAHASPVSSAAQVYGDDHTHPGERALRFGPPMGHLSRSTSIFSATQAHGDDHTHPGERGLYSGPPMGRVPLATRHGIPYKRAFLYM